MNVGEICEYADQLIIADCRTPSQPPPQAREEQRGRGEGIMRARIRGKLAVCAT